MQRKACLYCEAILSPVQNKQKYCSKRCVRKAFLWVRKSWRTGMWCRKYRSPDDQQRVRELGSYVAGMLSAKQGRPITDCPHERKSRKKAAWLKGWRDADKVVERACMSICKEMNSAHDEFD